MTNIKNPWHHKDTPHSKPFFEYPDSPVFSYRGVDVFQSYSSSFDYVLGDTAITQRAGFNKDVAPSIIDDLLDGRRPVCDEVAKHIKSQGFNPLTYDQYMTEYNAGRMS